MVTCCIDDDLCPHIPLCPRKSVPHVSTSDLTLYKERGGDIGLVVKLTMNQR